MRGQCVRVLGGGGLGGQSVFSDILWQARATFAVE